MNIFMKNMRSVFISSLLILAGCSLSSVAVSDPTVNTNYTLDSKTRVSRTVFDYNYKVSVTNTGTTTITDVKATATSNSADITVIEGEVSFSDIAAGDTTQSSDTFTIRKDRNVVFDESSILWDIKTNDNDSLDIQIVDGSEIGESISGFQTEDSKGNKITVYLANSVSESNIKIQDGSFYGKPDNYEIITNEFIIITFPQELTERQTIRVSPSETFNTIIIHNPNEETMERTTYTTNDQGEVEFRAEPINGKVIFSLVFITE